MIGVSKLKHVYNVYLGPSSLFDFSFDVFDFEVCDLEFTDSAYHKIKIGNIDVFAIKLFHDMDK